MRESMLMMGLRQWVLWTSWFIKQLIFMSVWVVVFTILYKVVNDSIVLRDIKTVLAYKASVRDKTKLPKQR